MNLMRRQKWLFLREDLMHLFDEQGIDASQYDDPVDFRDPITKFDSLSGYLFNIAMLKHLFKPTFALHDLQQTGPWEITSRWTMTMKFLPIAATPLRALWEPTLVFTGTSIYGFNPASGRINRHWDTWDSISDQQYFSVQGLQDMLRQMLSTMRPPMEGALPTHSVLQRRLSGSTVYEVRSYTETDTPTFTFEPCGAAPRGPVTPAEGGCWAVLPFAGLASASDVASQELTLREALRRDGLEAAPISYLLRHPDTSTPSALRRNEVLIPLEQFDIWGDSIPVAW